MTRLLITGASGNVGTALLRRLRDTPDLEIIAVARRVPPPEPPYDRATWRSIDVSDEAGEPALADAMAGVDTVVNLAWAFQPTRDRSYLERVGVGGAARVLAAADRAGVGHLVHMSSVGTYARRTSDQPVDESFPHTGIPTSSYSRFKAAVEAHLDEYEQAHPGGMTVTRVRPGTVLQSDAGAALSRYSLPAYLPLRLLPLLPVLPLDRGFAIPTVHADDLADAVARIVERRSGGAFNIAAPEPLTRADVAATFGARPVHVPAPVLRTLVSVSWRLHVQPLSPGWIDMAFAVPLLDSRRAGTELGWQARFGARAAFEAAWSGIVHNDGTASPVLRPRAVLDRVHALLTSGPVSRRTRP